MAFVLDLTFVIIGLCNENIIDQLLLVGLDIAIRIDARWTEWRQGSQSLCDCRFQL